jgi:hypothetical protein
MAQLRLTLDRCSSMTCVVLGCDCVDATLAVAGGQQRTLLDLPLPVVPLHMHQQWCYGCCCCCCRAVPVVQYTSTRATSLPRAPRHLAPCRILAAW